MKASQPRFERRLKRLAFAVGAPGGAAALALVWTGGFDGKLQWTLTILIAGGWAALAGALVHRVVFPLQTLANLLGALREGDFSTRARGAVRDDALGDVLIEANALSETLREQRLGALEAAALLRTVIAELDAAVFAFDGQQRLRLANRAASNLLRRPVEQLLGRTAADLGLADCLAGPQSQTLSMAFPGAAGRFGVRRSLFRQAGRPHQLLVLADLSQALREEERQAWQRLVRVLGHELNNSLAPIKSIAGSLELIIGREPLPDDWREDARRGLGVISVRAESLTRFLEAYSQLAKLPPPRRTPLALEPLLRRVAALENRAPTRVATGPDVTVKADPDQIEQLIINLVRNAAEAAQEFAGDGAPAPVELSWHKGAEGVAITVIDGGPGLANPGNLFVPFFTTKPKGTGIGLTLCRQIAEAHGGSLTLENRPDAHGCIARLQLPLD